MTKNYASETGRTNITSLVGKKIVHIELVRSGARSYYRFYTSKKNFFDAEISNIFDKHGMFFEDDIEIPFP